jgi:type II secretory pathway pseudopilin PulG
LAVVNTALPQMFALPGTGRLGANVPWARATRSVLPRGSVGHLLFSLVSKGRHADSGERGRRSCGYTLVELLIVFGIIGLLLVLIAPAFTTIKGGSGVSSAAYTIKGALETGRTYAKANNTYTWVGFSGSIGSTVTGNVSLCVVASKDGTDLGTSVNQVSNRVDITTGLTPIGKVMRLENAHIGDTGTPQPSPSPAPDFETRASVNVNYRIGASGSQYDSDYYFIEQGTQFDRWIRFSPRGEAVVKGGSTQITQYAEVGLLPTHGTALAVTINPASGNLVAIQVSGFGGNIRIYRR